LRFCIRPLNGTFVFLAVMDIRARIRSHSRKGPERPVVPPDHGCDGETVSPSLHFSSQTSAGKPTIAIGISFRRGGRRPSPFTPRPSLRAPHSCALVPARSKRSAPACWRGQRPKRSDAGAERRERARVRSRASVHLVPPTVVGSSNMSGMNTIPGMACMNHDQYDIDRGIAETVQAL